MKKLVFFITAAVLFFSACQKEITPQPTVTVHQNNDTTNATNDTTVTVVYDSVTHVYDTVYHIDSTTPQLHVWIDEISTKTYATDAESDARKAIGFQISFTLHSDIEIYFDRDQMREIIGLSDTQYTNHGIYSFVSGYYTNENGMYKIQKNQPQYITLSMKISRDTSATMVPVHMSVPSFDYRTLKNGQFKEEKMSIGLKTIDVMF